jgi:hypothetical protein
MKKSILSAFAIVAIVGSALAFKAFAPTPTIYCEDPNNSNFCTKIVNFQTLHPNVGATTNPCANATSTFETSPVSGPCTKTGTVYPTDAQ